MREKFGEDYRKYEQTVPMLVPFIRKKSREKTCYFGQKKIKI